MNKVESVAKGENARFDYFFLLSLCFQKTTAVEVSKSVCIWESVIDMNCSTRKPTLWTLCNVSAQANPSRHIPSQVDRGIE